MLFDDIKRAKIDAMKQKDKDAVSAFNTLINRVMLLSIEKKAKGEELTDADVYSAIGKVEKELIEERDAFARAGREDSVASLNRQIEVISIYKPKMMSDDEIKTIILSLEDKSVPSVMKYFKENYAGKVDMKSVNTILRSI
ncbi:MAG: GatB/YqeY domain-containing protein [Clostridia bacterium]|nr:GatB/YqeY domain-containing protein [Clostridia bacterium]